MEGDSNTLAGSNEHYGALCTEFMGQLKLLLQQHHDDLLERLQPQSNAVRFVPSVVPVVGPGQHPGILNPQEARSMKVTHASQLPSESDSKPEVREVTLNYSPSETEEIQPDAPDAASESLGNVDSVAKSSTTLLDQQYVARKGSTFSYFEKLRRQQSLHTQVTENLGRKRSAMSAHAYGMSPFRLFIVRTVTSYRFDVCMSVLIISNVLFCGLEAEYLARSKLQAPPLSFHIISCWYTVMFGIELTMRIIADGCLFFCDSSWVWNYFDLFLVIISFSEAALAFLGSANLDVPNIRVLRMVRVVRVLRIARVMRSLRSLRILIQSVASTLKSLLWTLLLLGIILYAFAILFTEASTQHLVLQDSPPIPRLEEFFGTVGTSAFSLLKTISGGVNWSDVSSPLMQIHPVWVAFFLTYFSFTYFAVLNVVTGVFCQTAIDSAHKDQEMMAQAQMASKQHYVRQLQALFQKINTNNTGVITLQEFEDSMQDEKLCAYFASIDLSIDEAFSLFKLLDRDEAHKLDVDTFVTGCLKLRGQAKSIDVAMMMYETRWSMQKALQCMKTIESRLCCFQGCNFATTPSLEAETLMEGGVSTCANHFYL